MGQFAKSDVCWEKRGTGYKLEVGPALWTARQDVQKSILLSDEATEFGLYPVQQRVDFRVPVF